MRYRSPWRSPARSLQASKARMFWPCAVRAPLGLPVVPEVKNMSQASSSPAFGRPCVGCRVRHGPTRGQELLPAARTGGRVAPDEHHVAQTGQRGYRPRAAYGGAGDAGQSTEVAEVVMAQEVVVDEEGPGPAPGQQPPAASPL